MICKRKDNVERHTQCAATNNKGISLVTVIITVIVIIILALIVYFYQFKTTDSASFSKFVSEYDEVFKSVETVRLGNAKKSLDYLNNGFTIVNISGDIPFGFRSVSSDGSYKAYVVDLNYIGCDALLTGRDYKNFKSSGDTVSFGKDDVYVYDARGILYYAKGFLYDGMTYYEGGKSSNSSIRIVDVSQVKEDDYITVTITIEGKNEISSVTVGSMPTTKNEEGKYQINIDKNGNYDIIVRDEKGNQARSAVTISSLGTTDEGEPTVTATVTNGILGDDGAYTITSGTAKIHLTSPTAKQSFIGLLQEVPTEWLAFSENVERYFDESGNYTLYIYVKDTNGNYNTTPATLNIKVNLDKVKPVTPGQTIISSGDATIEFEINPPNTVWAKAKNVTIKFGEGMQSNGYVSSYATKTEAGVYNNYKIVYDKEVVVPITKNGISVGAKISYETDYSSKELNKAEVKVEMVDANVPTITSFERLGNNRVRGIATDSESGLASAPYLITMNYIDFSNHDINNYTWESTGEADLTQSGRYYFYARDDAGNVAVKSINVDAPDNSYPVIDSVKAIPEKEFVKIKFVAHDNLGITGYAIIKDSANAPETWTTITEIQQIAIEQNVTEDGKYYIWVIDGSGKTAVKDIRVITYKYPILDETYPKTVKVNEGEQAEFKVVITTDGYPSQYQYEWKVSSNNGSTWESINKATADTYRIDSASITQDGNIYKCIITNARGSIESNIAKLEVVGITNNKPNIQTVTKEKEMVLAGVTLNNGAPTTVNKFIEIQVFAINAAQVNIKENNEPDEWVPYENTITYHFKDQRNGTKTFYIKIKDEDGNVLNKVVSAEIEKID